MRMCFSTLACPNWTFPQILGAAAAHGLEGVDFRGLGDDIDVTHHPRFTTELDATLGLLAQYKLALPCFNTSVSLVTPAAERWDMMLGECQRYAELASRTGTKFLRIFGGAVPKGMSFDEALAMAQRHLRQLVKVSAGRSCQILVETHDDWSNSDKLLRIVGGFDPAEVGVLWDIEHPYRHGETPDSTADALKPVLRHIHIKDGKRVDGRETPSLLGEGELPLPELIKSLRRIGYDQWICLETEKRWHPQTAPEPEQSIPQFVKFMNDHWPR